MAAPSSQRRYQNPVSNKRARPTARSAQPSPEAQLRETQQLVLEAAPHIAARWEWDRVRQVLLPNQDGNTQRAIRVEARKSGPALIVASEPRLAIPSADQSNVVSTPFGEELILRPFDQMRSVVTPFSHADQADGEFRRQWYKSELIHELQHLDKGAHEYGAWFAQLAFLARPGKGQILARMISDEDILKYILVRYELPFYVAAVIEAFDGDIGRIRRYLPGSRYFESFVREAERMFLLRLDRNTQSGKNEFNRWRRTRARIEDPRASVRLSWIVSGIKVFFTREYLKEYCEKNGRAFWQLAAERRAWSEEFHRTGHNEPNDAARAYSLEFLKQMEVAS